MMLSYLLLLTPVYVALFWGIVLNIGRRKGSNPKLFLGKFMVVAFLVYVSHLHYFLKIYSVYIYLDSIYLFASLLIFPMYYIYVRLLTVDVRFEFRKHYVYFIAPFIVFLISATGYFFATDEARLEYIRVVLPGILPPRDGTYLIHLAKRAFDIVSPAQFLVYSVFALLHMRRHNKEINNYYSDASERRLGWVVVFSITLLVTAATGTILSILGREKFDNHPIRLIAPSLMVSTLLFLIGYIGNIQQPVLVSDESEEADDDEDKIPSRLKEDLISLFEREKYYLNKDFRIWDISDNLGTNRTYVSKLINKEFGVNFTTFVNNYRINHTIELLSDRNNYSVEEIAEMSGFGSINSLYRAFETKEGITLTEYRQKLKGKR